MSDEGGAEVDRLAGFGGVDCMSPLAEASLLVKEEMAQPVQEEESFCELPMRGAAVPSEVLLEGGREVSGREAACLRMRAR